MAVQHLKRAVKTAVTDEDDTRESVARMLRELEHGGEAMVREYARRFDGWEGDIVVPREAIARASSIVPQRLKDDIAFAHARVRAFAERQRASLAEFEVESAPGLVTGQRLVPVATAGCYVPGGRYAHVASAIMSVATARVAGVPHVIACSPARAGEGIHPAILHTLDLAGADVVLALGGVQAIAALAFGFFTGHASDILVGPGNRFVAEAKRLLFGRVGIDLFAGPTEICVIADDSADPRIVAADLVGQAEHGPDSPAWLITDSRSLALDVFALVPQMAAGLPPPNRAAAEAAWRDYGEVVLVDTREEAAQVSDDYAAEHLEVQARDADWWLRRLRNYGSLFLGEEATVAYGDKTAGPNHILPTKGAARYTGGLGVAKFIKILTYQRLTREASRELAVPTARISRLEGMEGHARTATDRLGKYYPGSSFDVE